MDKDVLISVKNVSKNFKVYFDKGTLLKERILFWKRNHYEKRQVLENVSFDIHKGETVGLIGRNGSGKSTMLKMLTGIYYPNGGTIETCGRISSLIELGAGFHPDMSGRDNIYTNASIFGLSRKEIDARLDDIIAFSELEEFIDNPVRTYSSGMYMRLAFSVAINVDADILLIDEILAVGDTNFQQKCFKKLNDLKAKGVTIVLVTHDSNTIQSFCDRAIWIEEGKVRYDGPSTEAVDLYLEYMSIESKNRMLDEEDKQRIKKLELNKRISSSKKPVLDQTQNHFGLYLGQIKKAYMIDKNGKETWIHESNSPCKLVIEYKIEYENKYKYVFGMGFLTRDQRYIYGTNTQIDNIDIPYELGSSEKIIFNIDNLPLLKGEYSVNVSIVDVNGTPIDFYKEYALLNVVSNSNEVGTTSVKHSWTYEEIKND